MALGGVSGTGTGPVVRDRFPLSDGFSGDDSAGRLTLVGAEKK